MSGASGELGEWSAGEGGKGRGLEMNFSPSSPANSRIWGVEMRENIKNENY